MRNSKLLPAFILLFVLSVVACSSDDTSSPADDDPIVSGELKLFLIDTARIKSIKVDGTAETLILDKQVNLNSYISALDISPNGEKLLYSEHQSSAAGVTKELRIANKNGSGDTVLFSSSESAVNFTMIKFLANDKICYVTRNYMTGDKMYNTVNSDGTGIVSSPFNYDIVDISSDERYLVLNPSSAGGTNGLRIIDRVGDNGAGSQYHFEPFDADIQQISDPMFVENDKAVVFVYLQNNAVWARIINMQTKTSQSKLLLENQSSTTLSLFLSMANDGKRGVLTIGDYNTDSPTVSRVFDLNTMTITSTFDNNDDNVFNVYAW